MVCTVSAIAKCLPIGYRPWAIVEDGAPVANLLQICTRMIRADYCGDGTSHTREGTWVNFVDGLGIETLDDDDMTFEASWGPDGAICVHKASLATS